MTALLTPEGHNNIARTDNRLETMLSSLVNKVIDEKLYQDQFENQHIGTIEGVKMSPGDSTELTEAISDKHYFIALGVTIIKK